MSLRNLVKERKAAARLEHPAASYTSRGQLQCNVCDVPIKHESLFAAHLSSKQHRQNVQLKAQAQAKRAREEEQRAAVVEYADSEPEEEEPPPDEDEPDRKRARLDDNDASALPADFFADPSQAPPPAARTPTPEPAAADEDPEWLAFERDVLGPLTSAALSVPTNDYRTIATVHAEPVLYGDAAAEEGGEANEATPAVVEELNAMGEPEETEEERQARLLQEEREELMARIEEEEREQMEADERVEAMKRRLAAVRDAKATLANDDAAPKLDLKSARAKKKAKAKA